MDFGSGLAKKAQSNPSEGDQPNNPDLFSSAKVVAGAAQSQFRSEDYDKAKAAGAGADLLGAASDYGKLDETQGVGKYVGQGEDYLRKYSNPDAAVGGGEDTGTKIPDSDDSAPVKTLGGDEDSGDLKSGPAAGGDYSDLKSTGAGGDSDVLKSSAGGDSVGLKSSSDGLPAVGGNYSDDVKTAIPAGDEKIDSDETPAGGVGEYVKKTEGFLSKTSGEAEGEETEGGLKKPDEAAAGDYLKEAEDVLKKPPGGDDGEKKIEPSSETQSGGGFGSSVMKMAGGFLKK